MALEFARPVAREKYIRIIAEFSAEGAIDRRGAISFDDLPISIPAA